MAARGTGRAGGSAACLKHRTMRPQPACFTPSRLGTITRLSTGPTPRQGFMLLVQTRGLPGWRLGPAGGLGAAGCPWSCPGGSPHWPGWRAGHRQLRLQLPGPFPCPCPWPRGPCAAVLAWLPNPGLAAVGLLYRALPLGNCCEPALVEQQQACPKEGARLAAATAVQAVQGWLSLVANSRFLRYKIHLG